MRFAVVLLSIVTAVMAQLTVNTPTGAITCLNQQVTWTGGVSPYVIQIQPGGDPSQAAIQTFTGLTGTSYTWFVTEAANTQVFIRLRDSTGTTAESGTFTIMAGGTCSSSGSASASTSGGTTPVATTTAAVTTPVVTTPVVTTPAGTTTTTPAAGGAGTTTTPATGAAGTTTTHASTTTGAAGLNAGVAGGAVGVLAGVLALLA